MTHTTKNAQQQARELIGRNNACVPTPPGRKGAVIDNWQNLKIPVDKVEDYFGPHSNILRLNGESSGGRIDVDCDWDKAVVGADHFLPLTSWVDGHVGNPASHRTYICPDAKTTKFIDPTKKAVKAVSKAEKQRAKSILLRTEEDEEVPEGVREVAAAEDPNAMIVEIRGTGSGTMMRGSVHPSGHLYQGYKNGKPVGIDLPAEEPTQISREDLERGVAKIASACLLADHWHEGMRNDLTMHTSGWLLHQGMPDAEMLHFIEGICKCANDEEIESRLATARATTEKFAAGEKVTGYHNLIEFITDSTIVKQVGKWLGLGAERKDASGWVTVILTGDFDCDIENTHKAVVAANMPAQYFSNERRLTTVSVDGEGKAVLQQADADSGRELLAGIIKFKKLTEKEDDDGDPIMASTYPPQPLVTTYIKSERVKTSLPTLRGVSYGPVLAKSGHLHVAPGYDAETQKFLAQSGLDKTIQKEAVYTFDDAQRALNYFLKGPLEEFMFDSDASLANALCLLWEPFVRPIIDGVTPLYLVDAPTRGSGKSTLARLLIGVHSPHFADVELAQDEKEVSKSLLAWLKDGPPAILMDNVGHTVYSPSLEGVLTKTTATGRVLGVTGTITVPNAASWVATANNGVFGGDLPSRMLRIGLDTGRERPEDYDYKLANLDAWLRDNREDCLRNALIPLLYWRQEGMPRYKGSKHHRAKSWVPVMGGICETLALPGFLDNLDELEDSTDGERQKWTRFVKAWAADKHLNAKACRAAELVDLAFGDHFNMSFDERRTEAIEPGPLYVYALDDLTGAGRVKKLSGMLKKHRKTPFGGFRIMHERDETNDRDLFKLEPVK